MTKESPIVGHATSEAPPLAEAPVRVLIVEHDQDDIELSLRELKKSGLEVEATIVGTREDFARAAERGAFDVILADYRMPGWTGLDALALSQQLGLKTPMILVTGTLGEELAVDCIKKGVSDYVLKHQLPRLSVAIRRALEEKRLREERARADEALREREVYYRTLVENAPEAIVVFDVDHHRFLEANRRAEELFRMSRSELLGCSLAQLSPTMQPNGRSSSEAAEMYIAEALAGKIPNFEWVHRNAAGVDVPCSVSLCAIPWASRHIVRGSIVDITDRKRSEIVLRESEARYRNLFESATWGLYRATFEGTLLDVNQALVSMLGYNSSIELLALGRTESLYVHPSERQRMITQLDRDGKTDMLVEWKRRDGRPVTVRLVAHKATDPATGTECVEMIIEDMTERLALEKKLQQSQKFEAFGQLAGGIAHDFNNMIGAILGWADMGLDETQNDAGLHRRFEKIRLQAERAAALTRQLLAFARRQTLEPRHVDLNLILEETLSLLEKVIGSNIEVVLDLAPGLAMVRADPTQIEQVVMNLCVNARDAMPDGGQLTVRTRNTEFDDDFCRKNPQARPGRQVLLSVSDTGVGMDAKTLDRIFEPFFTTKGPAKGTGLGLATVYGVIKQHGGLVLVDSELGKGTTFRLFLPVSQTPVGRIVAPDQDAAVRGGTETILVVEDHEGLRELARETLTALGYQVLVASDGEEALQVFRAHKDTIDLALLDVIIPKLSGVEVHSRICAEKPELPVIFATGYSGAGALAKKLESAAYPVLQKPYSRSELSRKIRETLDKHDKNVNSTQSS